MYEVQRGLKEHITTMSKEEEKKYREDNPHLFLDELNNKIVVKKKGDDDNDNDDDDGNGNGNKEVNNTSDDNKVN